MLCHFVVATVVFHKAGPLPYMSFSQDLDCQFFTVDCTNDFGVLTVTVTFDPYAMVHMQAATR